MADPYDRPNRVSYNFAAINFATTTTRVFRTPKNKTGRVAYAAIMCTTTFVGTSTPGKLQLGDGSTANKYIDLPAGTAGTPLTASHSAAASDKASGLVANDPANLPFLYLAADTEYTVTFAAGTGGSVAGVADCVIEISYF